MTTLACKMLPLTISKPGTSAGWSAMNLAKKGVTETTPEVSRIGDLISPTMSQLIQGTGLNARRVALVVDRVAAVEQFDEMLRSHCAHGIGWNETTVCERAAGEVLADDDSVGTQRLTQHQTKPC